MTTELLNQSPQDLANEIIRLGLNTGAQELQVKIRETEANYIRFANSEIHHFSSNLIKEINITSLIGKKKGILTIVPTNDEDIIFGIRQLIKLTKTNFEDPNQLPFLESRYHYKSLDTLDPLFTSFDQSKLIEIVDSAIKTAHEYDKRVSNVSGMLQSLKHQYYIENSNDLQLQSHQSEYWYGIDVLAQDNLSFGRNSQGETNRFSRNIPFVELAELAAKYAILGLNPIKLEPGDYPAILDYYATFEPLVFLNLSLSGVFVIQHRSFLAQKLGSKIFNSNFNWQHVPYSTNIVTSKPFDDEGVPTKEFYFIKEGILENFAHNRWSSSKMEVDANGCGYESERTSFGIPIATKLIPSENHTLNDLIKSVDNGVFVSRLFYSNWANPMAGILTGTTRNGFFKIKSGEITESLYPMRHTTSIFEMFGEGLEIGNQLHQPPMQMMPGVQSILLPAVISPKLHLTTYAN